MNRKDFYRKLVCVAMVGCMLTAVACAPEKEEVTRTEVVETERLEAAATEKIESASGESLGEVATENVVAESETQAQETQIEKKESSWVADLDMAETASQIIVVAADGSNATVSMHNKEDGTWTELLSTAGKIGRNGIGKTKEGDGKTPTGVYRFLFGFGNMPDPGCGIGYTQVDESYYWVDDSDSAYYNQFVSTNEVTKDWDSAEHIARVKSSYNYVLALDYNVDCVPQKGSAIFMHCTPTGGAGCIAVPEDVMVEIMRNVEDGCVVVIDSVEGVKGY